MKHITLILSLILLVLFLLPALSACDTLTGTSVGITDEQIEHYFTLEKDYEQKAVEARAEADKYWDEYLSVQPNSGYADQYEELAKRNDRLADGYMQQAKHYSNLASQN